jgi:hypothetical protein
MAYFASWDIESVALLVEDLVGKKRTNYAKPSSPLKALTCWRVEACKLPCAHSQRAKEFGRSVGLFEMRREAYATLQ